VSEDERNLTLERRLKPDAPIPPPDQLHAGMHLKLSGRAFTIREIGRARCVGGEGQLPFPVEPDEEYPYLDLATPDGEHFATVEYDAEGEVHAYMGRPLEHEQVSLDGPRPQRDEDLSAGAADVDCPNCGAPLERPGDRVVETIVCAYCGAQNDLTGASARVMGINPQGLNPRFKLQVGQAGTFDGVRYEVCGRLLQKDEEGFESREYLLWHPDKGYLWLAEEDGHWILNRPTRQAPKPDPLMVGPLLKAKAPIKIGDQPFEFYEKAEVHTVYVDGALPWRASVEDSFVCATMIAPPRQYEMESAGGEVEYFAGTYLEPGEVWSAFELGGEPPAPDGIHPAQPYHQSALARSLMIVGGIFALLNLALLAWSYLGASEQIVFERSFRAAEYTQEAMSEPFAVGDSKVMKLGLEAPVNDGWVAMDAALVDQTGAVQAEAGGEVSFYSGSDWTEGSQSSETYFQAPPAGTYRLVLEGERGDNLAGSSTVRVRLYQGGLLSRYYLVMAIVMGLFPAFEILRRRLFEARRWSPVMEDDDDDDDEEDGLLSLIS